MCSDLTDAMYWDKEDPNTVYHQFETKQGPNCIVKDDQIIKLALHYVWIIMIFNCDIAWYDSKGRRHTTTIESDRTDRDFIRQLVEARYPTSKVIINRVYQKWTSNLRTMS